MEKQLKVALFGTTITLGIAAAVSSNYVSAANDTVTANIGETCSLQSTVNTAHTATIQGGSYLSNIGQTTLTVYCNAAYGWNMSAIGYSDDTSGDTNMYNTNKTLSIPTGTATSGNTSNWAMKLAAVSGTYTPTIATGYNASIAVPSAATKVASGPTTDAGTGALGSQITSTYQTYISQYQAAGSYTGKVKYTLAAETPPPDITTISNMQDMTTAICAASTVGQTNQLKDTRDNKYYWVAKLADNNCWMTQNLDLNLSTSKALTSADSDVTSSWTPTLSTYTSTSTWNWSYDQSESYDPGDTQYLVTSGSTSDDTVYSSLSACTTAGNTEAVCQHGHSGNYYNWNAATAGSDASTMDDGDEATQSICPKGWRLPYGTQANKSWYYMLSNSISGYGSNAATSQAMRTSPFYIPRAGGYGGSVDSVGSNGRYWSSTVYGEDGGDYRTYGLFYDSSRVNPQDGPGAVRGYSVRCVSR